MIKANFNAYASYVTDSLYQYDKNQVLSVKGLNLKVAPEVHFSNANMDKAIVRQAELIDHVVSVVIPNSLLQDPLTIKAHIGIYEGNTFKVLELIEIPVIPKKKPADYTLKNDGEIYSFEELKNAIANMVRLSDFNSNNTAVTARIDNIIAHNNDTNGNTELIDIRTDIDGNVHDSAGTAVRKQFEKLSICRDYNTKEIDDLKDILIDRSINFYNPSLQTEDTISPHFFVNGVPSENTQFDNSYHCTNLIPIEPNTTYTIGLVPDNVKPWKDATSGIFIYDIDGNYLMGTSDNTFTTPYNARYLRFNFYIHYTSLKGLNSRCMLVKGNVLPGEYTPYSNITLEERVIDLENKANTNGNCYQYLISENGIKIAYPYTDTKDILIEIKKKGANNLVDFYEFSLFDSGKNIDTLLDSDLTVLQTTGTDWHAPFIVGAINNIDGDNPETTKFTGGSHDFNNGITGASATARTTSLRFFIDGREKIEGNGYANVIEVRWSNNVQGYNTEKEDGTGREILTENHVLKFKNLEFETYIELIPLEDILVKRWYGLQCVTPDDLFTNLRYVGGTNKGLYNLDEPSNCGDNQATLCIVMGDSHRLEMEIDATLDMGTRNLYNGNSGLFYENYNKAYFFIIEDKNLYANELYALRGKYRFRPS